MASAHSLSGLMKWLQCEEWREPFNELLALHAAEACARAGIALETLPSIIGEDGVGVLWGCVFEDFLTCELDDGRNIVDDYLKRRGRNESVPNKRYMAALRASVMSLYEISDVVRDQGFLARDLVRGGDPVRVSEKSGTHALKQWDRIAVRIVQLGSRTEMSGGALPFDHDQSEIILTALRRSEKKARMKMDADILRALAFKFTDAWLDNILQRTIHPTLPQMCNSDGDVIVWTTARYPLAPAADGEAIRLALARIPALRPEGGRFWNWIGVEKPAGRKLPADAQTIVTSLDDGSPVLGTLEITDDVLVLEANSRQRSERGRALIEPILGTLVGKPAVEARTMAELMAARPTGKSEDLSSGLSPDEERAIIRESLDRHYTNLLDESVPMLGNITPRQAAKTAKGRRKLVDWLKVLENGALKNTSPAGGYDLTWMWRELGIAELRR
jgi:hypothetical protein